MKDRTISLLFVCAECGKDSVITSENKLFWIVNTQVVSESRELMCEECVDEY